MLRKRDVYLDKLKVAMDEPFIKVITGVRRCGKSSILELFEAHLLEAGKDASNIVKINLDAGDMRFRVNDRKALYDLVAERLGPGRNYILLDEIQNIKDWEGALISMYTDFDADIYVTGSNAIMSSPDLGAKLVGRYLETHVLPLSFSEYIDFTEDRRDPADVFPDYMRNGGFPAVALTKPELRRTVTDGIYETIKNLDLGKRHAVKDLALIRILADYMAENIGSSVSANSIADSLNKANVDSNNVTIRNYLEMMEQAFLLYKADRFDVMGKERLKTLGKYYIVDPGLRGLVINPSEGRGKLLENIVFLELVRRGYSVSVGKVGGSEVDFVAERSDRNEIEYFQAAYEMGESVAEREYRPLMNIRDNWKKTILTMDRFATGARDGIECIFVVDWLLGK
ncbi:MAG: ATP-binding protein [Candidatus Methanoplasma sp.]|jgi:predicted AAA+ superfamily ATPase|nr:ATP-binding protein [Candidatus Methanoplasma sp.]